MAIASISYGSGGVVNNAGGSFTGDATATTATVGFQPRRIIALNETDNIVWEWVYGMAATTVMKTVAGGTRTLDTGTAISVSNGVITFSSGLAASAKVIVWFAHG